MSQLLQKYLSYIAPLKGSPRYHTFAFLSIISSLLERKCWLDRGRIGIIFPNTYTLLIGPPATGKSTSADLAIDFLAKVRPLAEVASSPHFGPSKITQAALYKELSEASRKYTVLGAGDINMSPLFLYASELSRSMDDFGGGLLTSELIDFYDSKGHNALIRKRTIKDATISFKNPSITLLGCTTQDYLSRASIGNIITSGLASRMMLVVEPDRVEKEREMVALDSVAQKEILSALNIIYSLKGAFVLNSAAYKLLLEESKRCDDASYDAHGALMQNYLGRKPDHITKVAMALAACDNTLTIQPSHISEASRLLNEIEPQISLAFGTRDIIKEEDAVSQIIVYIPFAPKAITRSDLLKKLKLSGKFVPLNGGWEALLRGLEFSKSITREISGSEEIYSRLY